MGGKYWAIVFRFFNLLYPDFTMAESQAAVDQMNSLPPGACGDKKYEINVKQSIFKKACALFNIKSGEIVKDHDLIYLYGFNKLLFMGAKHVDGKGFYTEDLRPKGGLQIPLVKSKD